MTTRTKDTAISVDDAEKRLQALHDRLVAGDAGVTPTMLLEAESLVRFAQARAEAAERAERERIEQEREAHLARIEAQLVAMDSTERDAHYEAMRDAIDAYCAVVATRNQELDELRFELQRQGLQAERGVDLWYRNGAIVGLKVRGAVVKQEDPVQTVEQATREGLARYHARRGAHR